MVSVTLAVQPFTSLPTTVYTVVETGEAYPVIKLRLVEGIQVYVTAPEVESKTLSPMQTIGDWGVTVIAGSGLETILIVPASEQEDTASETV